PEARLAQALQQALAGVPAGARLAVAVSGGADSAMLAVLGADYARRHGREFFLFHVHHGLQAQADAWSRQVQALAQDLDVPLHMAQVQVVDSAGSGIEAAAREARYQALARLASEHRVSHVLLAHHQDDQAETVLLR